MPITETQGTATDASTILVSNWSRLLIGIRSDVRVDVLKERHADNYQFEFLVHMRADVAVEHAESFAELIGVIP